MLLAVRFREEHFGFSKLKQISNPFDWLVAQILACVKPVERLVSNTGGGELDNGKGTGVWPDRAKVPAKIRSKLGTQTLPLSYQSLRFCTIKVWDPNLRTGPLKLRFGTQHQGLGLQNSGLGPGNGSLR